MINWRNFRAHKKIIEVKVKHWFIKYLEFCYFLRKVVLYTALLLVTWRGVLSVLAEFSCALIRCQQKFYGVERAGPPKSKVSKKCHL